MYPNYEAQYFDFMRQRREEADREWTKMISEHNSRQQQRLSSQQAYQPGSSSQYNAFRADVASQKEADDFPINKDGTEMFLIDESSGIIYLKSLNLGTGQWGLEIFDKRVGEVLPEIEHVEEGKPNPILESIAMMREEFGQLRTDVGQLKETVDSLPKELVITSSPAKPNGRNSKPDSNTAKSLQQIVDDVTQKGD